MEKAEVSILVDIDQWLRRLDRRVEGFVPEAKRRAGRQCVGTGE
jgi:hypothetical protein